MSFQHNVARSAIGRAAAVCLFALIRASYTDRVAEVPRFDPEAIGPGCSYAGMADHIAARIDAGDLPAGTPLPAERELAAEYHVAVGTARRAIHELRQRGLAVTLPAEGTFVTKGAGCGWL